ncbi:hypothetical protein EDB92DRAFT_1813407 [Lactarius akahatsu]|uniref:Protein kinase domain-containing protein n=1 Tax=Lactarius akahatsu TaxID=416441 RepID=A0AAD4QGX9_9AGAM|nr:hypothetical protein EDB92DRAFT_1813407 [Lactarius akahatsu]
MGKLMKTDPVVRMAIYIRAYMNTLGASLRKRDAGDSGTANDWLCSISGRHQGGGFFEDPSAQKLLDINMTQKTESLPVGCFILMQFLPPRGVAFFHQYKIARKDLRPKNVVIDNPYPEQPHDYQLSTLTRRFLRRQSEATVTVAPNGPGKGPIDDGDSMQKRARVSRYLYVVGGIIELEAFVWVGTRVKSGLRGQFGKRLQRRSTPDDARRYPIAIKFVTLEGHYFDRYN